MDIKFDILVYDKDNIFEVSPMDNQIWLKGINIGELNSLLKIIQRSEDVFVACFPYFDDRGE